MKPTGKNPYEIRLELLQLARSILQSQYEAEKDQPNRKPPTSDDVIDEAERLNAFVSNTSHHN